MWTLLSADLNRLEAFNMNSQWQIFNVYWLEHISFYRQDAIPAAQPTVSKHGAKDTLNNDKMILITGTKIQ